MPCFVIDQKSNCFYLFFYLWFLLFCLHLVNCQYIFFPFCLSVLWFAGLFSKHHIFFTALLCWLVFFFFLDNSLMVLFQHSGTHFHSSACSIHGPLHLHVFFFSIILFLTGSSVSLQSLCPVTESFIFLQSARAAGFQLTPITIHIHISQKCQLTDSNSFRCVAHCEISVGSNYDFSSLTKSVRFYRGDLKSVI